MMITFNIGVKAQFWVQNRNHGKEASNGRYFGIGLIINSSWKAHFLVNLITSAIMVLWCLLAGMIKKKAGFDFFNGIEKYRSAFLKAEPQAFVVPNHWDANVLFYVANGQGTITLIEGDSRQSHNIKRGELFYVSV
ncbi:putative rmlC-like cupin domain superfamily, rmlC-like jelly roll protein [Helianthus annuus]|uniref:RmlC-like cupin domain superfamily, rmlC-like jelly roll protein n=1 Tax=Helianthus annuus TaxID=4232 RepID=A0A9K3J0U1_HELAN|nr:putative rmlC-like cupin domain superfamily, rmlC-like jelly roll protein [Helianthus annuus]KAJ0570739.1 putative rmlC-like cupin domain superfamily, rmlC-like jelly roll protein [Helianthus annuus]KAJ0577674.1 putative rmlC-like cupin domain superfamily, rmlC-like jelly roll protein [Helianthus annuus]KAJ0585080.1 putative rmlC-like cupin domain superfamily, rmlC-like jelly roll protein [Helianthus annuus]KAJ0919539.1 putative rmlC-like cupin domain superfamily, rmlC-like jelly roll protei